MTDDPLNKLYPGLFNALVLEWVSPKCNTLMQTAVG
jgi:hypothetical protein